MEDEDFPTPIGKASATAGTLSHNHLSLVWDTTYTHKIQHDYVQLNLEPEILC
ncbi:Uncharacterized protein APZ42_010385 [Daphnia magna]|uniref:Uncharacterized protein n=1 Tax=Daphnia magna TaxID=35525 RepID=A0A164DEU4_9CRUS|nr:Uncharacterized protein APZ42_010385 [Daphnia magna]